MNAGDQATMLGSAGVAPGCPEQQCLVRHPGAGGNHDFIDIDINLARRDSTPGDRLPPRDRLAASRRSRGAGST
jgi:hypothetical protein